MPDEVYQLSEVETQQRAFFYKVYGWMALALALTGLVAMQVASSAQLIKMIFGNPILFFGLIIGELILVFALSAGLRNMNPALATAMFFIYAGLNGVTMSIIFLAYTKTSIATTFFVTAGTFAAMCLYGYTTKKDLTKWGNILFMALIGLVLASVVNIFLNNPMMYWIISYAGVLIFVGLTAYDTQKIKQMSSHFQEGTDDFIRYAVMGALMLYLDFINLFMMLLRILGNRRD